jgi:hypothetical protein
MDQSQIMSQIRSLEGVVEMDTCIEYSCYLIGKIPENAFILNLKREGETGEMYEEVFKETRWNIP